MALTTTDIRGARCPSCGAGLPAQPGLKFCPACGYALVPAKPRPAMLGLWLSLVIAADVVAIVYALGQYTPPPPYEGGTPESITDAGRTAAQVAIALSLLGMALAVWGAARPRASRQALYGFCIVGAFASLGVAIILDGAGMR